MGRITTVITSGLALTIIRHLKDLTLGVQSSRSKKEKEKSNNNISKASNNNINDLCSSKRKNNDNNTGSISSSSGGNGDYTRLRFLTASSLTIKIRSSVGYKLWCVILVVAANVSVTGLTTSAIRDISDGNT